MHRQHVQHVHCAKCLHYQSAGAILENIQRIQLQLKLYGIIANMKSLSRVHTRSISTSQVAFAFLKYEKME
jgi:hypothetical protein